MAKRILMIALALCMLLTLSASALASGIDPGLGEPFPNDGRPEDGGGAMLLDSVQLQEVYAGSCGANLTWSLNTATGALVIEGRGAMYDYDYYSPWHSYQNNIKSVSLRQGLTTIGDHAFYDCRSLSSVTIPDSVISIGDWAFDHCESLNSVTIPNSVTAIGERAFGECDSLSNIVVSENNQYYSSDGYGVLFNKGKTELLQYPGGNLRRSYKIPNSVTVIGEWAFFYSPNLGGVTIRPLSGTGGSTFART